MGVTVNDGTKEWRADGQSFVRGYRRVGPGGAADETVQDMLGERMAARKARDYDTADAILDELLGAYQAAHHRYSYRYT